MAAQSLGTLTVDLQAKTATLQSDLGKAARLTEQNFAKMQASAVATGVVIGNAISAGLEKLPELLTATIDRFDEFSKSAEKVNLSTEAFSSLAYAASLSEVGVDTLTGALGKLTKGMGAALDPTSKQAKIFKALGISVTDSTGNLRDGASVLKDFADKFEQLGGSQEAILAGQALFGKSFADLIPLLHDGAAGISDLQKEADLLGVTVSGSAGKAAEEFNDNLTRLHAATQGVFNSIAANLLPTLVEWSNQAVDLAKDQETLKDVSTGLTVVLNGIALAALTVATSFDVASATVKTAVNVFAGGIQQMQAMGKVIAHTLTLGFAGGDYKEAFTDYNTAAGNTATGVSDAWSKATTSMAANINQMRKLLGLATTDAASALKVVNGVLPKGFTQVSGGTASGKFGGVTGGVVTNPGDKSGSAMAQSIRDALAGDSGEKAADKAKKAAEELADAYAKLNEAVTKLGESADPVNKAYNTFADSVRNIDTLGADAIKKGADVVTVQQAVEQAVGAARKKLDADLAKPMQAAQEYSDALNKQLQDQKALIDVQVASIGMGEKEAANQQELAKAYKAGNDALADLQKQRDLHPESFTAEQYAAEEAALKAHNDAMIEQTKAGQQAISDAQGNWMNGVNKALTDFADAQKNTAKIAGDLTNDFLGGASDALADFVDGTKTASEAWKDFWNNFAAQASKAASNQLIGQLLGTTGSTGGGSGGSSTSGIAGILGGLFGNGGSGTATAMEASNIRSSEAAYTGGSTSWLDQAASWFGSLFGGARAAGGPVAAGMGYLVGENGPEWFSPGNNGTIIPNHALQSARSGGNRPINISFSVDGSVDRRTQQQIAKQAGAAVSRATARDR